jgi:hypothetical protein
LQEPLDADRPLIAPSGAGPRRADAEFDPNLDHGWISPLHRSLVENKRPAFASF